MSVIDLEVAKAYLNVIHDEDDVKLQILLDGAEDEALRFMDRESFGDICRCDEVSSDSSSEPVIIPEPMPAAVKVGVFVLLEAAYQASPDNAEKMRAIAERYLFPYRCRLGV